MKRRRFLVENLARYETLSALRKSEFYADCCAEVEAILATPEIVFHPNAAPRLSSLLRVAQWNIEKGKNLEGILGLIESHPALKHADILLLNEADCGMNRSGNRHVARAAAERLGMNMVFGPAHLELTRGAENDLSLPGDNHESLQGNAVLSRYPILETRITPLPVCFEPYEFVEKRYGARNCVWARLELPDGTLWVGSVHLEVRNTPRCRAGQMRHIMEHLPGRAGDSYLLGGDLNCNTFRRGTLLRTLQSLWRLTAHSCLSVQEELLHPERNREPLFRIIRQAGFSWANLNSAEASARAPLAGIEEAGWFPGFILGWIERRLAPYGGSLVLKLDWLFGRGIRALTEKEVLDHSTGVYSLDPGCVPTVRMGPDRLSDHGPIYADLRISGT